MSTLINLKIAKSKIKKLFSDFNRGYQYKCLTKYSYFWGKLIMLSFNSEFIVELFCSFILANEWKSYSVIKIFLKKKKIIIKCIESTLRKLNFDRNQKIHSEAPLVWIHYYSKRLYEIFSIKKDIWSLREKSITNKGKLANKNVIERKIKIKTLNFLRSDQSYFL